MKDFKQLYIFVEGPDDERIFENIFKHSFMYEYDFVKIIKYSCLTKKKLGNYIKTFNKQKTCNYLVVCDFDAKNTNNFCITKRKNKEVDNFGNILDLNKILIVKEEIESWYLAGINKNNLKKFKIKQNKNTELINKEDFIKLIPKHFDSKTYFLIEILKEFDIKTGINYNNSMKYFVEKYKLNY